MKRKIKAEIILLVFLSISMACVLCACSLNIFRKEYTITCLIEGDSYKEDITVKKGEKYKCPIPSRENYTFLYYTDEYGMVYTDDKGYCLSEFKEKKDITLISQWKGDEILISYNINGGKISGNDYRLVKYGSIIPSLPIPQKEHYKFSGWRGVDKNGKSFVIHDGMRLLNPKLTITKDNFLIEDKKITLTAQYDLETVAVTCIYEDNTVIEEKIINVPYGSKVSECSMPTIINQYGKNQGFIWSKNDDFEADEYLGRINEPITLYAVAMETQYFGYKARQTFDLSKLLVDFRTSNKTDINETYVTASGTKSITFIGNPSVVYTNFSVVVSATVEDLKITFVDFNYVGCGNAPAFDASGLSNDCSLVLNARGNASIRGANGGNGGNGQGSQNKGIAQAGHGGSGGVGGNGGYGLYVDGKISLESQGHFYSCGGNGGDGGNGGSGGNNLDKGIFDRADNGGNGGRGGAGGSGGHGIYASSFAVVGDTEWTTAFATGGNGGNGGNGGDGGETGKNEFQSEGGTPGSAGYGGSCGGFGLALSNCAFDINKKDGISGNWGRDGRKGTKS